jgi:hypothetical protein
MSFIDKIRVLEERYGVQNVRHLPDGGDVVSILRTQTTGKGSRRHTGLPGNRLLI